MVKLIVPTTSMAIFLERSINLLIFGIWNILGHPLQQSRQWGDIGKTWTGPFLHQAYSEHGLLAYSAILHFQIFNSKIFRFIIFNALIILLLILRTKII